MYEQYPPASPWPTGPAVPPATPYQQPAAAIAITTKYHPLAFILALFKPSLVIDGQRMKAAWGRTVLPVLPGQHHLHVHVPYLLPPRIGPADLTVAVHPGQTLELEYKAPLVAFIGGSLGMPPQRYRGATFTIIMLIVSVLFAICACVGGIIAAGSNKTDDPLAFPTSPVDRPSTRTDPTGSPLDPSPSAPFSPSTAPSAGSESTEKPTLRSVPTRRLIGATYGATEKTYTMAFAGWPFAFRTPPTWGCIIGKVDIPNAKAWVCLDEKNSSNRQQVNIILRPCPGQCEKTTRDQMDKDWFDPGVATKAGPDGRTAYFERARDLKGRYVLDVSHYFATTPGGSERWQVGVSAMAPPATKGIVQKIANDIYSQTP